MTDIIDPAIEAYAVAHTTAPPSYLAAVAEETEATLPNFGMMVGNLEGRFLELLVFATGATRILEIGTFTGYSSLSMAAGLAPGGTIVSCELNPVHAEIAQRHIAFSPYADCIEVVVGPALESIAELPGPFDLVFIDADKAGYLGLLRGRLPEAGSSWTDRGRQHFVEGRGGPSDTSATTEAPSGLQRAGGRRPGSSPSRPRSRRRDPYPPGRLSSLELYRPRCGMAVTLIRERADCSARLPPPSLAPLRSVMPRRPLSRWLPTASMRLPRA